ncbi:hypothetical protein LTR36_000433 [Oleoguttula mirabilis]|uniref:FAD-binding FR-type domain-containing protein n=1 Tax=Oleoguttula mirabilis TaxID=1507867 RepID=A0AAV9JZ42_9PEZI|nr:hypothetical protein LTR36_000433 [Oleoguttula mirabilis]
MLYRLRSPTLTKCCCGKPRRVHVHTSQQKRRLHTKPTESKSKGNNGGGEQQQKHKLKPKGSYTRILATFAVGIPLGWAAHIYLDDGKSTNVAKPGEFVRYALAMKEDISSTCSIFTLKPASNSAIDAEAVHDHRAITSVQFKQPQLQIARSYTVLPPVEGQGPQELRFLIRKERNGEVSGYLHRLTPGSEVELRGPSVDYVLPEHVQQVLFLAGGTGIAPATQLAGKVSGETNMHILWATRRGEDCEGGVSDTQSTKAASGWNFFGSWSPFVLPSPDADRTVSGVKQEPNAIVSQLAGLKKEHGQMKVDYYVDDERTFIRPADITAFTHAADDSSLDTGSSPSRLLFVSGPEGFVTHWAGPKLWVGGREVQGPLGGVLSKFDLRGWQIVKL